MLGVVLRTTDGTAAIKAATHRHTEKINRPHSNTQSWSMANTSGIMVGIAICLTNSLADFVDHHTYTHQTSKAEIMRFLRSQWTLGGRRFESGGRG